MREDTDGRGVDLYFVIFLFDPSIQVSYFNPGKLLKDF